MAKALRRMGFEVVEPGKDQDMSDKDVKDVTEAARSIAEVGQRAREVAEDLKSSVAEVHQALDAADGVNRALKGAAAELRGALGVQTNSPPAGEGE